MSRPHPPGRVGRKSRRPRSENSRYDDSSGDLGLAGPRRRSGVEVHVELRFWPSPLTGTDFVVESEIKPVLARGRRKQAARLFTAAALPVIGFTKDLGVSPAQDRDFDLDPVEVGSIVTRCDHLRGPVAP